jgi:hypothetical protein
MKVDKSLLRQLVYATGQEIPDLAVSIDASEKSIYKWINGTSQPDCYHFYQLLQLAGWTQARPDHQ